MAAPVSGSDCALFHGVRAACRAAGHLRREIVTTVRPNDNPQQMLRCSERSPPVWSPPIAHSRPTGTAIIATPILYIAPAAARFVVQPADGHFVVLAIHDRSEVDFADRISGDFHAAGPRRYYNATRRSHFQAEVLAYCNSLADAMDRADGR